MGFRVMDFEEWWEAHKDVPLPKPVELAFRAAFEAGQRYEREACAEIAYIHEEGPGGAEAIRARNTE